MKIFGASINDVVMYGMVFTQMVLRLILVSVVMVCLGSCMPYRTLRVEVLRPAKIQIETGKRVALLDRHIRRRNSPVVFQEKKAEMDLVKDFAQGLNYVFVGMNYDTVVPIETSWVRSDIGEGLCPFALTVDSVNVLCELYQVDYIISLELQHYEMKRHTIVGKWLIRLYESHAKEPLDFVTLQGVIDQPGFEDEESDRLFQEIRASFWDQGAAYARRIIPYWEETERRVYHRGKLLGMGNSLWEKGKTEEALKIWKAAGEKSDKVAIQAKINMAWFLENEGDFDGALKFLQEALEVVKLKNMKDDLAAYLLKYIENMELRIKQRDILEQQMNLEED